MPSMATRTRTITQTVGFRASPQAVYDALTDARQHAAFTGAAARISSQVGGRFSVWDGFASGTVQTLEPGRKIVWSWRAGDWPDGTDSTVTMTLTKTTTGTRLRFTQVGVPAAFAADVAQGWQDFYWTPLAAYLAAHN